MVVRRDWDGGPWLELLKHLLKVLFGPSYRAWLSLGMQITHSGAIGACSAGLPRSRRIQPGQGASPESPRPVAQDSGGLPEAADVTPSRRLAWFGLSLGCQRRPWRLPAGSLGSLGGAAGPGGAHQGHAHDQAAPLAGRGADCAAHAVDQAPHHREPQATAGFAAGIG